MPDHVDLGLQQALEEEKSKDIGTANWSGSQKLVADAAYVENGILYFVYDLSALFDGNPTFISYAATGVRPSQYQGNWGADGAGNQRVGPKIGAKPTGVIVDGGNFATFTLGAGDPARGVDPLSDDVKLVDLIDEGYRVLVDTYGFLFDEVDGEYPGIDLLFTRIGQGLSVTVQDLQNAGIGANVSQIKLDYLNASIASQDSDNPFVYTVNGEEVINEKYTKHFSAVEKMLETSLTELGLDPEIFERENKLFYKQLLNTLVKGDISNSLMTDFTGYVLGIEGYEKPDNQAITNLFSFVSKSLKDEQFSLSNTVYANALALEQLAVRKLGISEYNNLSDEKKNELILMYNDSPQAANEMLQTMFDNLYPEYEGKNLDFAAVKGKYIKKWTSIFGDAPDEENSTWLDQIGKPITEASKAYMQHAYDTGNEFFNRKVAASLEKALGGVVIR